MAELTDFREVVDVIRDLTRVTLAVSGQFESQADAIRRLSELGIAPTRLGALLGVPTKSIHAELSKAKKRNKKKPGR